MRGTFGRRLARELIAVCVLVAGAAGWPASATAERHGVAVLEPRVDPAFESLAEGFREWLSERLASAGIGVIVREEVQRALASRPVSTSRDTPDVAAQLGAAMVVMSELRFSEGEADLHLRLHDGVDGKVITAAMGSGRVDELGEVARAAVVDLLARLEFSSEVIERAPPPRLSDWSALARARARMDAGDPLSAWKELSHLQLPAARRLRAELEALGDAPGATPALRSRLANATGQSDRDWLRVRSALRRTEDPEMFLAAAESAAGRGEPETAARFYEQATRLAPENAAAHLGRADVLFEAGQHDAANEAYRTATSLAPDDPYPHAKLGRMPTLSEEERAQHMLRAGDLYAARLEPEAARQAYEDASQVDGTQLGAAYRNVARLDEKLGNHGEALLGYEQSVELGTRDPETLLGLGRSRARGEDFGGAEAAYREALALDGKIAEAHRRLGETLVETGRGDEAVSHLEDAIELDPARPEPRKALSALFRRREEMSRALDAIGIDGLPPDFDRRERAGLLREAAEIHQEQGDLVQAESMLAEAVEIEPDDPPLHTALASVYTAQGKNDLARAERTLVAGLTGAALIESSASPAADTSAEAGGGAYSSFAALIESFTVSNPKTGKPLERVVLLGLNESRDLETTIRRWVHPRRPDLEALEIALLTAAAERFPLDETPPIPANAAAAVASVRAFSKERETIATVNTVLAVDATLVARVVALRGPLDRLWTPERSELEVRLLGGDGTDRVFILANSLSLGPTAGVFTRWNYRAALPWTLVLAIILYPVVRGWGRVIVVLDYDTKAAKGFFNIKLSRRPGKVGTDKVKAGGISKNRRYQQKVRSWSRFAKNMAETKTVFRLVPARSWYVSVYGLLQDPKTQEVIGNYLEERRVKVARGDSTTLEFDFRPREAPVEVRLVTSGGEEDEAADVQAVVALRGQPDSARYARGGTALLHVPNGQHTVVVGWEDRVLEQQLLIQDFVGASLVFPIERDEMAVFTGCPDAVEPYLNGDLPVASQALDRAGHTELANLLRGEYHKNRGEAAEAARYYQAAGHVQEAAELSAEAHDSQQSATLFEHAGDFGRAADQYRQSGDLARAAAAYEAAYDYDAAIECYRSAGALEKVMDLLEKTGAGFDAAVAAIEAGDDERAIRNLQMVDIRDIQFHDACRQLAELFTARGEHDLAVAKLEEAMRSAGEDSAPLELVEQLADALGRAGETARALEIFESIRKRDYAYPGAAERIVALREQLQSEASSLEFSSGSETVAQAATAQPAAAREPAESRYEIEKEIGRGGMGVVYKARDKRLGRVIALKRLPENLRQNPTAVELFLREARAAAALNHPNIVTLFDADEEEGNYYLTMEFLDGLPLDAILQKRGRLSPEDMMRLATQICTGLQYAHERKVVHRDIKTSNLFFTRDRVVKIMDFGLAKMMEEVRRAATVIGGTPYYMAPEQATGEGVDHRADLYALGVTLFELVTGTVPFREGDVTYHHRHTAPPDPRSLAPELPARLAELILHLIAKDKNDRPPNAGEVGQRLAALLGSA